MKSEQEELIKAQTPCKECCFCEYENSTQVGCEAGRLVTFEQLGQVAKVDTSDDKTYSVIDRFCNYFRSPNWKEGKEDTNLLELAKKESACSFGVVIDCEDHSPEKIEKTLKSLQEIDYNKDNITVILYLDGSRDIVHLVHAINVLKKDFKRAYLVSNSQENKQIKDYDIFSKCVNRSHFTTLKLGASVPKNLFSSIDQCLNEDLAKIVYFESKETDTLSTKLVRKSYLDYLNYEKMLDDLKIQSKESNMYGLYEEEK